MKGPTGENLIIMLERRLDNVLWRAGLGVVRAPRLASSCCMATSASTGKKVNIPSYLVNVGEEIAIKEQDAPERHDSGSAQRGAEPERCALARAGPRSFKAKVVALPKREDVQTPPFTEQLIVELYSK